MGPPKNHRFWILITPTYAYVIRRREIFSQAFTTIVKASKHLYLGVPTSFGGVFEAKMFRNGHFCKTVAILAQINKLLPDVWDPKKFIVFGF